MSDLQEKAIKALKLTKDPSLTLLNEIDEKGDETISVVKDSAKQLLSYISDGIKDIKDNTPDYNDKLDDIYACVESLKDIEIEVEIV